MFDVRRRWHRTLHPHITTTRSEDGYVLHLLIMYVEYCFKRPFSQPPSSERKFAMKATRKLWTWLAIICVLSFAALGWVGTEIYLKAPPIPQKVVSVSGELIFTADQIQQGQQAWLSAGGQQMGTVWGHGSYLAPDWSADWLHREALALREIWAQRESGKPYPQLDAGQQGRLDSLLKAEMRRNAYDGRTATLTLSDDRAAAVRQVALHYIGLFGHEKTLDSVRSQYAMAADSLRDPADRQALTAFFFWSSWAAATDRPGEIDLSYTSNWPHEPLIANTPTAP